MTDMDPAALAGLARGEGGVRLGEVMVLGASCLEVGYGTLYELPFAIAGDGAPRYIVTAASDAPSVAVAHPTIAPARWFQLGTVVPDRARSLAALVFTSYREAELWGERWQDPPITVAAGGAVRLAASKGRGGVKVDGGDASVRVYVGLAADRDIAVAFVLDAGVAIGADHEGDDEVRMQRDQLASAQPGAVRLQVRSADLHPFVANLAPGIPRLGPEGGGRSISVTCAVVGELALPSRSIRIIDGSFADLDCWPTATDRMEVLAFHIGCSLEAWVVRAPQRSAIVRWVEGGFGDTTVISDGEIVVELEQWSTGERPLPLMIESNQLFVDGPDLSVARAFLGLDTDGCATALVVITA